VISKIVLANITSFKNCKHIVIPYHVKFSFTCDHKEKIETEIINKIINLIIFTFVKGINLILSGKDTRVTQYQNKVYNEAVTLYKKKLNIKNRK
jgi:hypothetical protein